MEKLIPSTFFLNVYYSDDTLIKTHIRIYEGQKMFSNVDESIKALSESFHNYRTVITAQSGRMHDRLMELRVERVALSAEDVQSEIDVLNFEDDFLISFARQSNDIQEMLHEALRAYEESLSKRVPASRPVVQQDQDGWFGRLMGRQKQVVQNEPQLNDADYEEFKALVDQRLGIVASLIHELETMKTAGASSLSKWIFHFKERVVDLSKQGHEKNLVEISLYESLVSVLSHHASKYAAHPFKLANMEVPDVKTSDQLEEEIGAALSESLHEAFAL